MSKPIPHTDSNRSKGFSTRARVKARRSAVQALYQLQFNDVSVKDIIQQFEEKPELKKADRAYFQELLKGIQNQNNTILQQLEPVIDRNLEELDNVELAILKLGIYELLQHPELPWRVVMNEAIELAKMFGAEDSYKYINSVLDKIARDVRKVEIEQTS